MNGHKYKNKYLVFIINKVGRYVFIFFPFYIMGIFLNIEPCIQIDFIKIWLIFLC